MARSSIPWAFRSYSGRTRVAATERCVNLYPERNLSINAQTVDASTIVLIGAPGCRPFLDVPGDDSDIVHFHSANRDLFVWTRQGVYRMDRDGRHLNRVFSGSIGVNVSAAHGVSIADSGRRQLSLWWTDGIKSYIYNLLTDQVNALSDDTSFLPPSATAFLDGYALFTRRGTDEFFWSDVLEFDEFNGLNFASAEGGPDELQTLVPFDRELWLIGRDNTEVFQNTGDVDLPFQRIGNAFFETGTPNAQTVVKLHREIYMVAQDLRVYRGSSRSYRLEPISTHQGLDHDLNTYGVEGAFAFGVTMEGHDFYWLTLPSANRTWVYDLAVDEWHERSTLVDGLPHRCIEGCDNETYGRHFATAGITHEGKSYIGGAGHVYELTLDYGRDGDARIMREAATSPLFLGGDRVEYKSVELEFQNACGNEDINLREPGYESVTLAWTDNQAKSWVDGDTKAMYNKADDYRPVWSGLGSVHGRAWRWRTFSDKQVVFLRGNLIIEAAGRG